jgi:ABC-type phosphate transport system substrate-binding protein
MITTKMRALAGASVALLSAVAAGAHAQTTAVYGGGSTLSAPYVRQAEDCFGVSTPLYTPGAAATGTPTEIFTYNVAGVSNTTDCSVTKTDPAAQFFVEASGSGAGVQAFFDHNPASLGTYTDTDGTTGHTFPTEHYGTSDTALSSASVAVYNGGGTVEPATGKTVNVVAPGVTPTGAQFANPLASYGPLVQVPLLITPITVAYSPVYKKVAQADGSVKTYSFNITNIANKGVLRLDLVTYCKIFNGQITDWNDPAITALNGKKVSVAKTATHAAYTYFTPINDPTDQDVGAIDPATQTNNFSLPIELVGRADSSGTTSIFSRALAAQCTGLTGVTNQYPDAGNKLPSTLLDASGTATPGSGKFSTRNGSGGVANYMAFTAVPAGAGTEVTSGKIAYLSPDYVAPVTSAYGLVYAALQNYANALAGTLPKTFVLPTPVKAAASYAAITAPTGTDVTDPSKWVQAPSKSAAIATPTGTGYPIVGTTQILAYTCYADQTANSAANVGYKVNRFLYFYLKNPVVTASAVAGVPNSGGILAANGFAPMPALFRTAEYNTFVLPNTTNLYVGPKTDVIQTTGVTTPKTLFKHNPSCNSVAGG